MKSQRGVRLPTAPPTRKHGDENRYRRSREHAQNWHDYLAATVDDLMEEKEMEQWEAQELADEMTRRFDVTNNEDGFWDEDEDDDKTETESETDQDA